MLAAGRGGRRAAAGAAGAADWPERERATGNDACAARLTMAAQRASTFAAPASPTAARPAHDPPTPHARFVPTRDKVSGRFVRAGRLSSPAMILARPPAATPLAGADSLPAALEDVTQAGGVAREYLGRVRASLRARHEAGAGGLELVAVYTDAVDPLVRFLFACASPQFMSRFARLNQQCTVVAQGGYGRGELNPGSDIDLLFLYPGKV